MIAGLKLSMAARCRAGLQNMCAQDFSSFKCVLYYCRSKLDQLPPRTLRHLVWSARAILPPTQLTDQAAPSSSSYTEELHQLLEAAADAALPRAQALAAASPVSASSWGKQHAPASPQQEAPATGPVTMLLAQELWAASQLAEGLAGLCGLCGSMPQPFPAFTSTQQPTVTSAAAPGLVRVQHSLELGVARALHQAAQGGSQSTKSSASAMLFQNLLHALSATLALKACLPQPTSTCKPVVSQTAQPPSPHPLHTAPSTVPQPAAAHPWPPPPPWPTPPTSPPPSGQALLQRPARPVQTSRPAATSPSPPPKPAVLQSTPRPAPLLWDTLKQRGSLTLGLALHLAASSLPAPRVGELQQAVGQCLPGLLQASHRQLSTSHLVSAIHSIIALRLPPSPALCAALRSALAPSSSTPSPQLAEPHAAPTPSGSMISTWPRDLAPALVADPGVGTLLLQALLTWQQEMPCPLDVASSAPAARPVSLANPTSVASPATIDSPVSVASPAPVLAELLQLVWRSIGVGSRGRHEGAGSHRPASGALSGDWLFTSCQAQPQSTSLQQRQGQTAAMGRGHGGSLFAVLVQSCKSCQQLADTLHSAAALAGQGTHTNFADAPSQPAPSLQAGEGRLGPHASYPEQAGAWQQALRLLPHASLEDVACLVHALARLGWAPPQVCGCMLHYEYKVKMSFGLAFLAMVNCLVDVKGKHGI